MNISKHWNEQVLFRKDSQCPEKNVKIDKLDNIEQKVYTQQSTVKSQSKNSRKYVHNIHLTNDLLSRIYKELQKLSSVLMRIN